MNQFTVVTAILLLTTGISALSDCGFFLIDIVSQFRWQELAAMIVLLVVSLIRIQKLASIFCVVSTAFILWTILESQPPSPIVTSEGSGLKITLFNVNFANQRYSDVIHFVNEQQPDIAIILETSDDWSANLQQRLTNMPHQIAEPRNDPFGISLHSRHEMIETERYLFGSSALPCLFVKVQIGSQPIWIVAVHLLPPISQRHFVERNAELREVMSKARVLSETAPVIVAGDFNLTSFAATYKDVLNESGLMDANPALFRTPTWPSWFPPLGIELDHVWISKDLGIKSYHVGESLGSDHYSVTAEVVFLK